MERAFLPKALAVTLLTASLSFAGAQQPEQTPDNNAPQQQGAHHHHRHAPNPQRQAEFLSKKLNLTPDQTAKVEPILANRDQQMQALRQNQQLSPEDRHQQMRTLNQQAQQQMAGVLSPEQMAQLKTMRREHRHHEHNGEGADTAPSV